MVFWNKRAVAIGEPPDTFYAWKDGVGTHGVNDLLDGMEKMFLWKEEKGLPQREQRRRRGSREDGPKAYSPGDRRGIPRLRVAKLPALQVGVTTWESRRTLLAFEVGAVPVALVGRGFVGGLAEVEERLRGII